MRGLARSWNGTASGRAAEGRGGPRAIKQSWSLCGAQIWVAHEANGSLSVVDTVASSERWPLQGLPGYLWTAVQWRPEGGRFQGGRDWQGRNVHGFAPLTPRRWQLAEGKLSVGDAVDAQPGPIRPRRCAPQLDGPARAYLSPRRSAWRDPQEAELALIDLDLVSSPHA